MEWLTVLMGESHKQRPFQRTLRGHRRVNTTSQSHSVLSVAI